MHLGSAAQATGKRQPAGRGVADPSALHREQPFAEEPVRAALVQAPQARLAGQDDRLLMLVGPQFPP
jgi:hypothetical protein